MYGEKDAKTIANMEPMLTKKFAELADEVERTVPPSGDFKPLRVLFEDETRSLDIVYWSLTVCYYELKSLGDMPKNRYLILEGHIARNCSGSSEVGFGTVEKCVELLKSPAFVAKVMKSMKNMLNSMENLY